MKYLIFISLFVLSGCSSTPNIISSAGIGSLMNLIALTEEKAPIGVKGTFELPIKSSGIQGGIFYLNTEADYRDRRNITVAIHPKLIGAFTKKFGESPDLFFTGKTIEVTGEAKRVKIFFFSKGEITEKYYFQTHVRVTSLSQINVLS